MAEQDQDDADSLEGEHDGSYGEDGIRRPMNAFFIFCKRHRDVVREKYPHLENRSITKILGEWWANLDATEKSSYTALAKQYKEAFMKAHPDFKWYKLPTPPTRTLVTRPTNSRCLQSKRDKNLSKTSPYGITLGKLADEEHLGGLSSLISPSTSESSTTSSEIQETPSSSSVPPISSSNNILKPPKKRYLVNGEFKCHTESLRYDSRDHQTQNACSALLELAEICANSANHASSSIQRSTPTSSYESLFNSLSNTTSTNTLLCKSSITLKNLASNSTFSSQEECLQTSAVIPHAEQHLPQPVTAPLDSCVFSISDGYSQQLQDQPLNLCKGKEKTFTAKNQQLIDHLVDKFLCDSPTFQCASTPNTPIKSVLEPSISDFASSKVPNLSKNSVTHHGFTLSAAIESAIDQAYSKDVLVSPKQTKLDQSYSKDIPVSVSPKPAKIDQAYGKEVPVSPKQNKIEPETAVEEQTEIVFIDKIKKACLASSRKLSEKPTTRRYTPLSTNEDDLKTEQVDLARCSSTSESGQAIEAVSSSSPPNDKSEETKSNTATNVKAEIKFKSSSKYYSKFGSPPKKSRVWCNLFMKEQLKNGSVDDNEDIKKSLMLDLSSPVRRNSQRTCKGRRYQALITEGLLQSSKERKTAAGKKPLPTTDKIKTRQSTAIEMPPVKMKKRKKDPADKKSPKRDSSSDSDKNIFDLNEKIASLPKCSIDILNKKKKSGQESVSSLKSSGNSSVSSAKKSAKTENVSDSKAAEPSAKSHQNDSSSSNSRYKSGSFDLEQHIASLPKCDIEVLNKRRSKKE